MIVDDREKKKKKKKKTNTKSYKKKKLLPEKTFLFLLLFLNLIDFSYKVQKSRLLFNNIKRFEHNCCKSMSTVSTIVHMMELLILFTQPLRSGRIWHKVSF